MHEQYKEQHPLLCDDLSDEEKIDPYYKRSYRPMSRGRARTQAKGAASIISQWPDHWVSSVSNWCMALGMFALTIFIVYNSVLAFALLPQLHTKAARMKTNYTSVLTAVENCKTKLPEVFLHVMVEADEAVENSYLKYIPVIDPITYKYPEFKYNLFVIRNDINYTSTNDYQNNEIAMNTLWNKPMKRNNVMIHNVILSHLMHKSPIMKNWRQVPKQFMDFLIRAVLIWDKGGIALSSEGFISSFGYNKIVDNLLKAYVSCNETQTVDIKAIRKANKYKIKPKKNVNNIQDIINMLEHENDLDNASVYSLTEAENRNLEVITATHTSRDLLSVEETKHNKSVSPININEAAFVSENNKLNAHTKKIFPIPSGSNSDTNRSIILNKNETSSEYNKTKLTLLPLFLQFLFHDKAKINLHKIDKENTTSNSRQRKSVIDTDNIKPSQIAQSVETKHILVKDKYRQDFKPMIVPGKESNYDIIPKTEFKDIMNSINVDNLTIDIKGNILATRTPCHAFLGTMFQSVVHHLDPTESLQNFVITELTVFCKGLLSSCRGIDVILM